MKRNRWLLCLLLALIVLPFTMFLAACGKTGPSVTSFSVYIDETLVSASSRTIAVEYGDSIDLDSKVTVKLDYSDGSSEEINSGDDGYTYSVKNVDNETVVLSNNLAVGDYIINISYGEYLVDISLRIGKRTPTMTLSLSKTTFGYGENIVPIFSGNKLDSTILYFDTSETPSDNLKLFENYNGEIEVGTYYLWASTAAPNGNYNDYESNKVQFEVVKGNHSEKTHTAFTGTYSPTQTLADFNLDTHYTWVDATIVPTCDKTLYQAKYNNDSTHYNDLLLNVSVTLSKATTIYTAPTSQTATYGDTLSDVDLSSGTGNGVWSWEDPTTTKVGDVGTNKFSARFTPSDAINYETVEVEVDVTVNKKLLTKPTLVQNTFVFDGREKSPDYVGFDENLIRKTGYGAVDASINYVRFFLKDTNNYAWADGTTNTVEYTWTITPKPIAKPTLSGSYTYNGTEQTANIATSNNYTISGNKKTNAGSYNVTVSLNDEYNYSWDDETNTDLVIVWNISKATPTHTAPNAQTATYGETLADVELTGGTGTGTWAWEDPTTTKVGNVGTNKFIASFTPTDQTNYTKVQAFIDVVVEQYEVAVPMVTGSYTYNGTEQTANIATSTYYTLSGVLKGTNAGSIMSIIATLNDPVNTKWGAWKYQPYGDNKKDIVTDWIISKATPTYTAPTELTATYGETLADIELTGGTGAGTWAWKDSTLSVGEVGTNEFSAIFTPTDSTNYKVVEVKVDVSVTAEETATQPTAQKQLGFDGTTELESVVFNKWYARANDLFAGDADLTVAQFNALIGNLNARFSDDANIPTWDNGIVAADPDNLPFYNSDNVDFTTNDWVYFNNNNLSEQNDHYFAVTAYKLDEVDNIRLVEFNVFATYATFENNNNAEDIIVVEQKGEFYGKIIWGQKQGSYIIDPRTIGDVEVTFDDSSTATGKLDLANSALSFTYQTVEYNFRQKADFEVDLTTGIDLKLYNTYNYFNTNGKFRMSFEDYEDETVSVVTCTEWSVGEGADRVNYASMKREMYSLPLTEGGERTYLGTYETIFDVTFYDDPEKEAYVYIYYSTPSDSFYKTLPLADFFDLIKSLDSSLEFYEELFETAQMSYYCFGGLYQNSGDPLTETQLEKVFCQTGKFNINGVWFTQEGYTCNDGWIATFLFDDEGNMTIDFEGSEYITPTLEFSNYPIIGTRAGYEDWIQSDFEEMMQNIYGTSNGSNGTIYESSNSENQFIFNQNNMYSGEFIWGDLYGTFIITDVNETTHLADLILFPIMGNRFTGTFDQLNNTISLLYQTENYAFTCVGSGSDGGNEEDSGIAYDSENSSDTLYILQTGPTSGTFSWGELVGVFSMVQQGTTSIFDFTFTLNNDGGTFIGTKDMAIDVISFTYNDVDYVFENSSHSGGGENSPEVFESDDSEYSLFITHEGPTSGTFSWGELSGTFELGEPDPSTYIAVLTITPTTGSSFTGTYDITNNIIIFTYNSNEYTYTSVSGGGENESNQSTYESDDSDDQLIIQQEGLGLTGTFSWGELVGVFSMVQQGTTSIYDLTMTLNDEGGVITGTVNVNTDVIEFTYNEVNYVFENIYNSGGEEGASEQIYESTSSEDQLILNPNDSSSGDFTWGALYGYYSVGESDSSTGIAVLTISPNEADSITGTYDFPNDTISFTYDTVNYTFTRSSSGGGESTSTTMFESYNLPTNFKAVWTGSMDQTHTMIKVGDNVYLNINSETRQTTTYYGKQSDGTYTHWILENENWELQGTGINAGGAESSITPISYFRDNNSLMVYASGSTETYGSFENCRTYVLTQEETVLQTVWMHADYDLIVVEYLGEPSDTALMSLNSLDTTSTTFADFGISGLPE